MNTINTIYKKALEVEATGIMIECSKRNIFLTDINLSFKINGKWVQQSVLDKVVFKNTLSSIENNIKTSKAEEKEKTYFDKAMSIDNNKVLVTRYTKSLFIEFDSNKDNVLPFMAVAA